MTTMPQRSEMALSALDTILKGAKAWYLAVPVTSGSRLWALAHRLSATDLDRIRYSHRAVFDCDVLNPNVDTACELAGIVEARYPGAKVINPAVLVAADWTPEDYRSFLEVRDPRKGVSCLSRAGLAIQPWMCGGMCGSVQVYHSSF